MDALVAVLFGFVAALHLLPAIGILSAARLESLYGVALGDANVVLLMRHRAALFAVLGGLLAAATVREELRGAALACGLASVASFLLLARSGGPYNRALRRVVRADLAVLAVAATALRA